MKASPLNITVQDIDHCGIVAGICDFSTENLNCFDVRAVNIGSCFIAAEMLIG